MSIETGIRCDGWDGPCDSTNATRARQDTQYMNDEENWKTLCPECWESNDAYCDEMWQLVLYDIMGR